MAPFGEAISINWTFGLGRSATFNPGSSCFLPLSRHNEDVLSECGLQLAGSFPSEAIVRRQSRSHSPAWAGSLGFSSDRVWVQEIPKREKNSVIVDLIGRRGTCPAARRGIGARIGIIGIPDWG